MVCLPSFILAGVGKCGTTDVWDKIVQHPDIVKVFKEPRWWTRARLGRDRRKPSPLSGYLNHFHKLSSKVARNITAAKHLITGDGSPSIYWDNVLWKNFLTSACTDATTPTYFISDVIRAIVPESKIISVFRNPTDRLYSDYMFENRSCTSDFFHQSIVKTTRLFYSCLADLSRRECVFKFFSLLYTRRRTRMGRWPMMKLFKGFYSVFITDWMDAFPRDQLKFIRLEDWHSNCEGMLPEMYTFLELSPLSTDKIKSICSTKQGNPTEGKEKKGPMLEETREILKAFYKPTLVDLADILGDNRFLWND
ncbi:carbohydrate sulfotransferase 15-like [Amphiura filiformis]|uniref:carbohydrate sulfotransferase 15-like n=1 Tax=Amphiura filiformis TaxID=82378 RepID=UPI003B21DA36